VADLLSFVVVTCNVYVGMWNMLKIPEVQFTFPLLLLLTTRRVPGYPICYPVGYPGNELPDNGSSNVNPKYQEPNLQNFVK